MKLSDIYEIIKKQNGFFIIKNNKESFNSIHELSGLIAVRSQVMNSDVIFISPFKFNQINDISQLMVKSDNNVYLNVDYKIFPNSLFSLNLLLSNDIDKSIENFNDRMKKFHKSFQEIIDYRLF